MPGKGLASGALAGSGSTQIPLDSCALIARDWLGKILAKRGGSIGVNHFLRTCMCQTIHDGKNEIMKYIAALRDNKGTDTASTARNGGIDGVQRWEGS